MSIADWLDQVVGASAPFFIYVAFGAIVFIKTGIVIAFFLPGDSILFAAGLIAGTRDDINIVFLVTVIFIAAFLGNQVGYVLGRKYGRAYLQQRSSPRIDRLVARAEDFYAKYGWSAVILARFYPWIRTFMPPIAGIAKMDYYKFLAANALGALLWGAGITLLGYYAVSIPVLKDSSRGIALFFIVLTVVLTIRNYRRAKRD